jgi:hypothetical protein
MRERTTTKLRETKFFFQRLIHESDKDAPSEPEAFLFYLNAFLTSGESVRCFLEEDYGYERRNAGRVFKFMNEQRNTYVRELIRRNLSRPDTDWARADKLRS